MQFYWLRLMVASMLTLGMLGCGGGSSSSSPATGGTTGFALTVTRTGVGTVNSNPGGISCGSDCTESYSAGTSVVLTATPMAGFVFSGWGGACSGTGASCTVTLDAAKDVSALFTPSAVSNGGPQLLFSDIVSGPSSGNGDTSRGTGGAIVTVWGRGLGSTQGTSVIDIGGVTAPVYEWKNATSPAADMYSRHSMQMVSFLVPSVVPIGTHEIRATVNGVTTNSLPFTVRTVGNIRYVTTSGDDTDAGTWAAPWGSIAKAVSAMDNGDIVYVGDGVNATTRHNFNSCINLGVDGTAELPRALVAYPGATVNVGGSGATCNNPFDNFNGGANRDAMYWVVAKLRVLGVGGDQSGIGAYTGYRLVGNYVRINRPHDNCQSAAISGEGNDLAILGNQITDTAVDNPTTISKLCHTIYISGKRSSSVYGDTCGGVRCPTESNREIGWNLLNDNYNNRGINIYSEQDRAAFLEEHYVHDNYIINQRGDGILIGYYVTGENWFYNNVLINTGLGPDWDGGNEPSGHYAIQINGGHESGRSTRLNVWNNTIQGGGYTLPPPYIASPLITWFKFGGDAGIVVDLDFRNNIIVSPDVPYWYADASLQATIDPSLPNLWFGQSAAPSWNTGGISADPRFADAAAGNLRLQAGSPAIDRGTATPMAVDFDGIVRPQQSAFDLGAFEYR